MSIKLSWNPNPTEERVGYYEIYKGDSLIGSTPDTSFIDKDGDVSSQDYSVIAISRPTSPVTGLTISSLEPLGNDWPNVWKSASNDTNIESAISLSPTLQWSSPTPFPSDPGIGTYPEWRNRLLSIGNTLLATKHYCQGIPAIIALNPLDGQILWQSFKLSEDRKLSNTGVYSSVGGFLWCTLPHEIGRRIDLETGSQLVLPDNQWGYCAATSGFSVSDSEGLYGYGIGGVNSSSNPQIGVINPDGTKRWTKNYGQYQFLDFLLYAGGLFPSKAVLGHPAKYGETLYVPMGQLNALNVANGSLRWSIGTYTKQLVAGSKMYYGIATIHDNLLYCPSRVFDGSRYGLPRLDVINPGDGSVIHSLDAPEYPTYRYKINLDYLSSLTTDTLNYCINQGIAYLHGPSELRAVDILSGEILWTKYFLLPYLASDVEKAPLTGPTIFSNNSIFIIHRDSLIIYDTSGNEIYSWKAPSDKFLNWLILAYDKLFLIDISGIVYCLS